MSDQDLCSVLVAHDEPDIRAELVHRLDGPSAEAMTCDGVGSIADALDAFALVEHDVVASSATLPDGAGADLVERVNALGRPTATVLLLDSDDPLDVADAVRSGAHCVTTVEHLDAGLLRAMRDVPADACVLERRSASSLAAVCPPAARTLLSPRELEVLTCLSLGLTNAEAASRLFVSRETIKTHVARVIRKLDVADRRAAAERARLLGLLPAATGSAHAGADGSTWPAGTTAPRPDHRLARRHAGRLTDERVTGPR